MKHIPFILASVAVVALALNSCDDSGSALLTDTTVSITSSVLVVPYQGGTYPIRFTIGNARDDEGGHTVASPEVDWITDFDFSVTDTVWFFVAENPEKVSRVGDVQLLYMLDADTLATNTFRVSQEYNSVYSFDGLYASGRYYGMTNYPNDSRAGQYSIYFSDTPIDEYGVFDVGVFYYYLDFWSNADVDGVDSVSLPAGEYSLGKIGENWTVSTDSQYFVLNSEEEYEKYSDQGYFSEGSLTVTQTDGVTTITGTLGDYNGGVHEISYSDVLSMENFSILSTLEGDEAVGDLSNLTCEAYYYGDYYQTGVANWVLHIEPEEGTGFMLDISAADSYDLDGGVPVGTFSASYTGGVADTFYSGTVFNGFLSGTWLVSFDEEGALTPPYAPICDGTVEISVSGESYMVTIDGYDDRRNNVTGSWTGVPTISDSRISTSSLSRSGIRLLR